MPAHPPADAPPDSRTALPGPGFAAVGAKIDTARRLASASAVFGPRGFGHRHDRSEIIEDEATAIREAAGRALAGESLSSIVRDWNHRGLRTTTGRPWRLNTLSALLIQPRLAGLGVDERGGVTEMWPAIVDRATHERLVELRRSRASTRRLPKRSLLAGLLRCGRCGGSLHYSFRTERMRYYRCPSPAAGGCSGVSIPALPAEELLIQLVGERLSSEAFRTAMRERSEEIDATDLERVVQEIREDRRQLQELSQLWARREITKLEWQQARRSCVERLQGNEARLEELASVKALLDAAREHVAEAADWERLSDDRKQQLLRTLLDHVVVEPVRALDGGRGRSPAEDRMRPVWRVAGGSSTNGRPSGGPTGVPASRPAPGDAR